MQKRTQYRKKTKNPGSSLLLYGHHAVQAALLNSARQHHCLYGLNALPDWINEARYQSVLKTVQREILTKEQWSKLLPPESVHQGVALTVAPFSSIRLRDILNKTKHETKRCFVVLDQVTDPHNIGAIMRSACAFGATGLVVQEKHAPAINGLIAKTACGAVEHLPYIQVTNIARTLEMLQKEGLWCLGLDERGEQTLKEGIQGLDQVVLVLGAEGSGLRPLVAKQCDTLIKLPTCSPIESLNVSNAAAVALYETAIL